MSYDVEAGTADFNFTSNMRRFFTDFGVYPPSWDGVSRHEVADQIDTALASINTNSMSALKSEYDASNGWGKVEHAIGFLTRVRDACRYEIPEKVKVGW